MTSVVLFTAAEAKRETARLKRALAKVSGDIASIKEQLAEADKREVWRASGYHSMAAYITGALGMSRSNAYRTLDQVHAQLMLGAGESVPRGTVPMPSQREAAAILAPIKPKKARRGPPSLHSWLGTLREYRERIDTAFENEPDDALAYLSAEERREFERTVTALTDWCERWGAKLSGPIQQHAADEWDVA